MKKILFIANIVFLLIFSYSVKAQELTNYNLYVQNPYLYNPAYTIDKCRLSAYVNSHLQWVGFDGAPKVNTFGVRGALNSNMGLGLTAFSFKQGLISSTNINLNYAYRATLGTDHFLTLGVALGALMDNLNTANIVATDANDLLTDNFKQTSISAKFGVSYFINGFEAQLILPQLYERKLTNFYTIGILSYDYPINSTLSIKPAVKIRGANTTPTQFDGSLMANYKKMVWAQVGYRSNNSLFFGIGLDIKEYSIGYAYQMENNYINTVAGGTHEIQLVVRFGCMEKKPKTEKVVETANYKVSGNVISKDDGKAMTAKCVIVDKDGKEVYNKEVTGNFSIDLPLGKYTATFTGETIITKTETFTIAKNDTKEFKIEVKVKELKADKTFDLGTVTFETGKTTIKDEASYKVLDELVAVMIEYPELKVEIGGHTDNVGDDAKNMTLSQTRAQVCMDYVVSKGVASSRLTAVGYGETKPLVPNDTDENKAKNRRTEFKVVN